MAENNNNKLENGTVRDKIILFLRDGKPKHFTDITKGLTKHDFTINRELKILIDSNWILKTGKKPKTLYSLDLTRDDVQEYLKHADVAIPADSNIKKIEFDINATYPTDAFEGLVQPFSDSMFDNFEIFLVTGKHFSSSMSILDDGVSMIGLDKIFYEALVAAVMETKDNPSDLLDKPFKIVISYNPKKD